MFMYREDKLIDANKHFWGALVFSIRLINLLESCMYEGSG